MQELLARWVGRIFWNISKNHPASGFFSAVVAAIVFRLLSVWTGKEATIVAVFKTQFPVEFPYDPKELLVFGLIGVLCGLGGALYCKAHRNYVVWMRSNKQLSKFLQRNRFIYPFIISCLVSLLTFPHWAGTIIASDLPTPAQVVSLFRFKPAGQLDSNKI